jgi:hypothetical protein
MKILTPLLLIGFIVVTAHLTMAYESPTTPERWVELGSRKVNFGLDRDVIDVTYSEGYFDAIKIVVTDGAINMHKCTIHFENGGTQDVELRHNFKAGSDSRIVDLKGNKRFIKKIEFWYDTKNMANKRATVTVLGRR